MSGNANTNFQQTMGQVVDLTSMTQFVATEKIITPDFITSSPPESVSTNAGPPGPPGRSRSRYPGSERERGSKAVVRRRRRPVRRNEVGLRTVHSIEHVQRVQLYRYRYSPALARVHDDTVHSRIGYCHVYIASCQT